MHESKDGQVSDFSPQVKNHLTCPSLHETDLVLLK